MRSQAISPEPALRQSLPGSQFIDAFAIITPDTGLSARAAADQALGSSPAWARALLATRDRIVAPLGLKASHALSGHHDRIGIFPVISEAPERVVVGLDDEHLDFRAFIDTAPAEGRLRVTVTTVVRTHNLLGRAYLAVILPFHRVIVRAMLEQIRA